MVRYFFRNANNPNEKDLEVSLLVLFLYLFALFTFIIFTVSFTNLLVYGRLRNGMKLPTRNLPLSCIRNGHAGAYLEEAVMFSIGWNAQHIYLRWETKAVFA